MDSSSVFSFKRFDVRNERSAMKVNTDGVLLGALAGLRRNDARVLDIGTGTGTVALMLAQRLSELRAGEHFTVEAIDIDKDSADEAALNFSASPWPGCLVASNSSLVEWAEESTSLGKYDLIASNPPFFEETLHSPDERKAQARHADSLSWREITDFASARLEDGPDSRLSLILPASQELPLRRYAAERNLYQQRIIYVRSSDRKPASRIITEFSRQRVPEDDICREYLSIHRGSGYSDEYLSAVHDFLLFA